MSDRVAASASGGVRGLPAREALTRPVAVLADAVAPKLYQSDPPGPPGGLAPAAVVALLTEGSDAGPRAPGLVLIERGHGLRTHAGQIAFPGGKPEPHDPHLLATALREADEEVGLAGPVRSLGRLPPVPTPTGFWITPFVAVAPAGFSPTPRTAEVRRVLCPALRDLADPERHRITGRYDWHGRGYDLHEFDIGTEPPLWGATARMVWELLRRLHP